MEIDRILPHRPDKRASKLPIKLAALMSLLLLSWLCVSELPTQTVTKEAAAATATMWPTTTADALTLLLKACLDTDGQLGCSPEELKHGTLGKVTVKYYLQAENGAWDSVYLTTGENGHAMVNILPGHSVNLNNPRIVAVEPEILTPLGMLCSKAWTAESGLPGFNGAGSYLSVDITYSACEVNGLVIPLAAKGGY